LIPHFDLEEPLKTECKNSFDCILDDNGVDGLKVVKFFENAP